MNWILRHRGNSNSQKIKSENKTANKLTIQPDKRRKTEGTERKKLTLNLAAESVALDTMDALLCNLMNDWSEEESETLSNMQESNA